MLNSHHVKLSHLVSVDFVSPEEESFKFGYYNYSPLSKDGTKLLAHKIGFEGRNPLATDVVEVGYFHLPEGNWVKLAETKAFNWQQGAMLQWLGPDFNTQVVFNDALDNAYISRVLEVNDKSERTLPKAIYSCVPDGSTSITLHFERAHFTRAYSYESVIDNKWNQPVPSEDGIIKLDMATGDYDTIIDLKQVIAYQAPKYPDGAAHWLEHIIMNREGNCFVFYHRYGSVGKFETRCLFADLEGNILGEHPQNDSEFVSHIGWNKNKEYVLFTRRISKLEQGWKKTAESNQFNYKSALIKVYRAVVKPFVPKKLIAQTVQKKKDTDNYQVAEVGTGKKGTISITPANIDGHPSFTRDGRFMLTDTYEDAQSWRHLVIYDTHSQQTLSLGKFYSVYNNCGWRTDLHPRFSWDEKSVVVDSNHNGKNSVIVLKVDWEKIYEAIG